MTKKRSHLLISNFQNSEKFKSKKSPRNPPIPFRERIAHGQSLLGQYSSSIELSNNRKVSTGLTTISELSGVYLELASYADCKLPLSSLDNNDFSLQSIHVNEQGCEVAVVFIADSKRQKFSKKIIDYLEKNTRFQKPQNRTLIDSIASIKLANIQSFWTDFDSEFPKNTNEKIWWELWLQQESINKIEELLVGMRERLNIEVGKTRLRFTRNTVVMIKASVDQLELAVELVSCISELRKPKETPNFFTSLKLNEQKEWVEDLKGRVKLTETSHQTAVSILDTGINYNHPLLSLICDEHTCHAWNNNWPKYETSLVNDVMKHHGSLQAGLVMFGNLTDSLVSQNDIYLNYRIESGKIFHSQVINSAELYGAITKETCIQLEAVERRRVYSLAITATNFDEGGAPSSWSGALDNLIAGFSGGRKRLFVVSCGNNRELRGDLSFWDQAINTEIEDPAQSWNSISVGGYTNLDSIDPEYDGWSVAVERGDISPATSTSLSWGWQKNAPFKPDVVEEAGNRLVSPKQTEVVETDGLSLLTTSGNATGQLFDTNRDTSAACALVSRIAAILTSANPQLKEETIRGLIIHSAEWTDQMLLRKNYLDRTYERQTVLKQMLRTCGYGVPNLEKAQYSADNVLTLISENTIQPFTRSTSNSGSGDAKLNEMHLYALPWPAEVLQGLPQDIDVKLKVTLSYFVESNPSRRGYRDRFSYQSHGLRFDVKRSGQLLDNFKALINKLSVTEEYKGPEGSADGWMFGPALRTRGSIHSDTWVGPAAHLADMDAIAVYPVGGWWKQTPTSSANKADYSLIVTIEVPDESVNIYSPVLTLIENQIPVQIEV